MSVIDARGNALGCKCPASTLKESDRCSIDEMETGICFGRTCSIACSEQLLAPSTDQTSCVKCGDDSVGEVTTRSMYDQERKDCMCSNPPRDPESKYHVMTRRLQEIYDTTTGLPIRKDCIQCPRGTAVITDELIDYGSSKYHITAGAKYEPDPYICASCPDPDNMYFNKEYQCECIYGFMTIGEASVGEQTCMKYLPSISADYAMVEFNYVPQKATVSSIIFSHYYLKSASDCEFSTGTPNTFQACQTLANLCVMRFYDDLSAPCREFQIIASKRMTNYRGQDEWKAFMPWLYYLDESEDVVEDRGIKMKMAFREHGDHEYVMNFKVAKFTVSGEYLGIEDLTNQFMYCGLALPNADTQNLDRIDWLRFGNSIRHEYNCNLNFLLEEDMYFYDIYIVDRHEGICDGWNNNGECLYPVPVLIKNFVEGGSYPNQNKIAADEHDDRYTRRFFLHDNMVRYF